MREALARVKAEIGPDAVIIRTRSCAPATATTGARGGVEITAAAPARSAPQTGIRSDRVARAAAGGEPASGTVDADHRSVHEEATGALAGDLRRRAGDPSGCPPQPADTATALREAVARLAPPAGGITLGDERPMRVALVGPTGAGKTTTLAKLAAHFKLRLGKRVGILTLDGQRLGTREQLGRYAELIGVPVEAAQNFAGVQAALSRFADHDLLLIDTPGVGPRERSRFVRLASLVRAGRPHETHLVLPASYAPDVQERVARSFAPLGVTRAVLTRLDEVVGLRVVLDVIDRLQWSVSYLSDGQRVPNDLQEASAARLLELETQK